MKTQEKTGTDFRLISFNAAMREALEAGRKTQTRRLIPGFPEDAGTVRGEGYSFAMLAGQEFRCRYGEPGTVLVVREPWAAVGKLDNLKPSEIPPLFMGCRRAVFYGDDPGYRDIGRGKKRHERFMPYWAGRRYLRLESVRFEPVNAISEVDAFAEGVTPWGDDTAWGTFRTLWDSIHGHGSFDAGPMVWALTFRPIDPLGAEYSEGNNILDTPRIRLYNGVCQLNCQKTLLEATRYFSDPLTCVQFVASLRWPDGVTCPHCGGKEPGFLTTRLIWKCRVKECRKQFSVKVGTIFEDSPLPLDKWLIASWMIANCKNGISSYELHRDLGVTQKTAWFMLHRIRIAMQTGTFEKLTGTVEADETFIGGRAKNMHQEKREEKIQGRGSVGKEIVIGILERSYQKHESRVKVAIIPNTKKDTLQAQIAENIKPGAEVFTDAAYGYRNLPADYQHQFVDHAVKYVENRVHTNGLENFWCLTKRTLNGTYVSVEPAHLMAYLDEQSYRFNNRKGGDLGRFADVIGTVAGRRITYKELIARVTEGDAEGPKRGG